MRRLDKEIKDQKILDEILQHSQVCRIGFAIDNIPHIVPVNFAYEDNKIYIHSAPEGNKINMIRQNDYVCFEMELHEEIVRAKKACGWTTKYRSVIGWGTISIEEDNDQKISGLDIIMKKYGSTEKNEYSNTSLDQMVLIVIEIDNLTGKQSGSWE